MRKLEADASGFLLAKKNNLKKCIKNYCFFVGFFVNLLYIVNLGKM